MHTLKYLLLVIAVGALAACASPVPVDSLADAHDGHIVFASFTPGGTGEFLSRGAEAHKVLISGELSVPGGGTSVVPAVIILHGSSGVNPGERVWAQRMNALGYASFVVDSFTGRGIRNTEKDQSQLAMTADIADAYAALRLLSTDSRIDRRRIAVMGFSRGGVAALYSTLAPFHDVAVDGTLRFAAHVAFYPSCGIAYDARQVDGAPVLMLLGGKDDYTPAAPCAAYAQALRAKGVSVTLKAYPQAYHGFDRPTALRTVSQATSARDCHGTYDLDRRQFTMLRDGESLTGAAAVEESRRCLSRGVTLGGDPQAQAESPTDVAAFLKRAFE
ncbi:MAG: dienelactone hydrolase family protein [Pandoraea sp.]|nr:dienelactone hydrolase family protein [Pandoraea sp.]MDR3398211.1 dienelactone hydrolase family protein [Pandoraea sp.]